MLITIKSEKTNKEADIFMPITEGGLQNTCEKLGIENNMKEKITILSIEMDDKANKLLKNKIANIDELNFLVNKMSTLDACKLNTIYAVAYAEKITSIKDLINLTYNTHCYDVVSDFNDLETIGRRMYQNSDLKGVLSDFKASDFEDYAETIFQNQKPVITPYGLIYYNENKLVNEYNGKTYPSVIKNDCLLILEITKDHSLNEDLYLPAKESEINKAVERIESNSLNDISYSFITSYLPEVTTNFILENYENINEINETLSKLRYINKSQIKDIDYILNAIKINTKEEFEELISAIQEFEIFSSVKSAEEYGKYMIIDSGRYEYDENLEEYIDFERYGKERMRRETGAVTKSGYIIYHGYNENIQEILTREFNIKFGQSANLQELKLYMPLKAVTYQDENDYGDLYQVDFEIDFYPEQLAEFEDEIRDAVEERSEDLNKDRGLMEYFSGSASVNAKVKSFAYDVEIVKGELMGVAKLMINAPLTEKELDEIKEYISGQSSDGWGEGFEQREIKCNGREIYISFWNSSDSWSLKTEEEIGISPQTHEIGGMSI